MAQKSLYFSFSSPSKQMGSFPSTRAHNTHKTILQHIFKVTPKKGAKLLKLEIFNFPLSIYKKKKKKKKERKKERNSRRTRGTL